MKNRNSHPLLDALIADKKLKNDAALANLLKVQPPQLSKLRHGKAEVSDSMRVTIMRKFRWTLARVDALAPPAAQ